jgi:hypothetical protein
MHGTARKASPDRSDRQELAIDLSRLVGKLPADGYLILTDIPDGARLSQGHDNGDRTWTVFCEEISGLKFLPGDIRGVVSLNALIFSLDPGANRAARQVPLVLHTDDAVQWTASSGRIGSAGAGTASTAHAKPTSNPGALLSGPSRLDAADQSPQLGREDWERPGPNPTKPNESHPRVSKPIDQAAARKSKESEAKMGEPVLALFAGAEQRWGVEVDRLFSHAMTELRQEAERALRELEHRHAAEMKDLTEAVRTQHSIIAALELSNRRVKEEAAAQLSAAERTWQQGEADRMKAAQEEWARHEDALNCEIDRNRSAAEQLETTLLALKEQSVAKERDAEARLDQIKLESERMLRNARSEWQREVAKRLESAGVQILAVFNSSAAG